MADSVQFHGPEAITALRRGEVRGLNLATELLRTHSVIKAPVDLGDLKASASVEPATEAAPVATLIFDEPYAAAEHEHTEYHHTPGRNGEPAGEAKYVESNYTDASRRQLYADVVGQGVADALAGR